MAKSFFSNPSLVVDYLHLLIVKAMEIGTSASDRSMSELDETQTATTSKKFRIKLS
jgi:hypothetical protein